MGGNAILNINIKKAFDIQYWNSLVAVLEAFGYNVKFQGWVREILNSVRLSILINSDHRRFFECEKG